MESQTKQQSGKRHMFKKDVLYLRPTQHTYQLYEKPIFDQISRVKYISRKYENFYHSQN